MNNFPFFCLHPKVMQKRYRNIRIQNIFFPAVMLQWGSRHRAAALKLAHRPFTFFTDQNLHLFFRMKDFQLPKSFHPARHLFIHFFLCQIIVLHLFFRIGTCLIAGLALWIGTYLIGQLTPWMLENLTPAGTFFLFAAMCVPYILIIWKAVPETTGRSLEEIEKYWQK